MNNKLSPFDYFKNTYTENYANFKGRARRAEYWYFHLFFILGILAVVVIMGIFMAIFGEDSVLVNIAVFPLIIFVLASYIPMLALTVRRLHDTNKSGWFLLLNLIPIISMIIFVFMVIDGDKGNNNYGHDPKRPHELEIEDSLLLE